MKKILSCIFALAMMFSLLGNQFAFATDVEENREIAVALDDESGIQPYGTLNGYGADWYSSSSIRSGEFTVNVTGSNWVTAQTTLKIEEFDSKTCVRIWLYSPTGVCLYDTLSWAGGYLTMSNPEVKKTFAPGSVGTYRVRYEVFTTDGSAPSSGRVMCWIY